MAVGTKLMLNKAFLLMGSLDLWPEGRRVQSGWSRSCVVVSALGISDVVTVTI